MFLSQCVCDDRWHIKRTREMHPAGLFVGQGGVNTQVFCEVGLIMQSGETYYLEILGPESPRNFPLRLSPVGFHLL
jgi:hypothetical protein